MKSTHRAENIFPKYLLYYVHEIARKYPRENTLAFPTVQCQFVASIIDAELLCTAVSDTAIGKISLSQAPLQMK
jgi:hypothetical protein